VIDFTLSQLLMRACAVLLIATLQGSAIAMAAGALGDAGPKHDGRLSIDPLRHMDLLGGAVAVVFAIGWGRWPFLLPLLPDTAAATAFALIQTSIELGLWFAVLGLLPLPPLAGGHLLVAVLPKLRERLPGIELFLGLILAALVAAGVVTRALDPAFRFLMGMVLGEDVGM
jgi:Zn-dependent protease